MATRSVTHTLKNADYDITALANPFESWSPRSVREVIVDIESGTHRYVVRSDLGDTTVQVVDGRHGKYLRTHHDLKVFNNLDELPEGTGTIPAAPWSEIVRFAPLVQFHSNEEYFPMDPMEFIASSRFRHHRGLGSDQGYTKAAQEWRTNDSHHRNYYDIPVDFIDDYSPHSNGKNRRPRDSNNGDSWNVFLQPSGKPSGDRHPTGRVPVFVHAKQDTCAGSKGADHVIQYWWFFGYNDGFASQNHQGDWEHASIVVKNGSLIGAYFAAHASATYYDRSDLEFATEDQIVVYIAKGSHAAYPRVGSFHTFDVDKTNAGGAQWDTSRFLLPLRNRPWKDFAGAWGEVGTIADTTGPLGPWHKRYRC
ncbi:MAG: Vps62-related protein [Acidimicrobiia bacterium]